MTPALPATVSFQTGWQGVVCARPCRFLAGDSDSDEDDARRVVKSEKQKRMEELGQTAEDLRVRDGRGDERRTPHALACSMHFL